MHFNLADHDDPSTEFPCGIGAIVAELLDEDDNGLIAILLGSGASVSAFPLSLMEAGVPASGTSTRFCDAQGQQIPVEGKRLGEIRLPTNSGRSILLKEMLQFREVPQPFCALDICWNRGFALKVWSRR